MKNRAGWAGAALTILAALGFAGCSDDGSSGGSGGSAGSGAAASGGTAGAAGMAGSGAAAGMAGSGGTAGVGGGFTGLKETICPSTLVPPAAGVCEVTSAGQSGLLLEGTVLAPNEILRGGQVAINAQGIITCVACDCSAAPGASQASRVTCAEGVISPGLINTHDHITYANNTPKSHGTERYDHRHEWRRGLNNHTEIPYDSGASANAVLAAELRFLLSGATSTISSGGRSGLLRNLDRDQKEGLPIQTVLFDTFPLDDGSSGIMRDSGCNYGSNPTTASSIAGLDSYTPHIAEGVSLAAENELTCTSMGSTDVIEPQTAIIHAVGATARDVEKIYAERAWVIWSPRSNVDLYGNTAPITLLDSMGVGIALGTDWIVSGSMNLSRELRCADELNQKQYGKHFSDFALWQMVTTNAAFAAGAEKGLGMLKPGYVADVSIFDATTNEDHRAVIAAQPKDVVLVLREGTALYGDDALMNDASIGGAACETIDVCAVAKRACVQRDTGTSLAAVRTTGEAYAPLFECGGPPPGEPSCVPMRPNEYDGADSASGADGDGIDDATDNCPAVFNPIRPMDKGAQADADSDGKGDVCDPCPLDPTDACTALSADDIDGDGWANGVDNCPDAANPSQADADMDGHGDDCDACKMSSNPGLDSCALSLAAVRNPADPNHPPAGSAVELTDLYVTAIRPKTGSSQGFYVQESSLMPYTGIFVFTKSSSPTVQIGNKISVRGVYDEYFDVSEIGSPTITVLDAGTTLPFGPVPIANPADIATGGSQAEAYESMLLEVSGVMVTVTNPDAPQDFDEFTLTGNLRVDDLLYPALDNNYAVGTTFSKLAGIHSYSFNIYKLLPRSAADVTP